MPQVAEMAAGWRRELAALTEGVRRWVRPGRRSEAPGSHRTDGSTGPVATDGGSTATGIEMVVAIVRPGKLSDVKQALAAAGAPSLTVTNVSGRGTQPSATGEWHDEEYFVDLHQKVKIECVVEADRTDGVVDAIQAAAETGQPGDGKIFVLPVYDACRVSTNERGRAAM